ncbi:uncharacterized protein LOC143252879 [Tachypleus tridentatus]|uniref:uncharacterized protein LOC143252879 n=1 Tax=Tachypleus tridentatus TaxID=6853 RepID=UPI003FCF5A01
MISICRIVLLLCVFHAIRCQTECSEEKADYCASLLIPFNNYNALIPLNTEELEEYCRQQKEMEECVTEYSDLCLDSLVGQLSQIFIQGAISQNKERCEKRDNYLKYVNCVKKIFQPLRDCMKNFILDLELVSVIDIDLLIPTICCSFGKYRKCAVEVIDVSCSPNEAEYFTSSINGYSSDLVAAMCLEYEPGSSRCQDVKVPRTNTTSSTYLSIFPSLNRALNRLGNEDESR